MEERSPHLRVVARGQEGARLAVFDSTDAGISWSPRADVESKPPLGDRRYSGVVGFAFDERDLDRVLLLGGPSPARATRDGGRTWASVSGCDGCVDATFTQTGQVIAVGGSRAGTLFRSTDGGMTFSAVAAVPDGLGCSRLPWTCGRPRSSDV